jgi:hypothetical protein
MICHRLSCGQTFKIHADCRRHEKIHLTCYRTQTKVDGGIRLTPIQKDLDRQIVADVKQTRLQKWAASSALIHTNTIKVSIANRTNFVWLYILIISYATLIKSFFEYEIWPNQFARLSSSCFVLIQAPFAVAVVCRCSSVNGRKSIKRSIVLTKLLRNHSQTIVLIVTSVNCSKLFSFA